MPKRPPCRPNRPRRPSPPLDPLESLQQMFLDRAEQYMNHMMDQMMASMGDGNHTFLPITPPHHAPKQKPIKAPKPQPPAPTLYDVLQVSVSASPEVISGAWRSLCKMYHPDIVKGQEKRMRAINEAYELLSDPRKRRAYDQHLRSQQL